MKICALTMVYRDYWALDQWYRHHGALIGHANLFVVAHGHDPRIQEICPLASVITVPRDRLDHFDGWRGDLLNGIQNGLLALFDWVIRTDADELICTDPDLWESLQEMLAAQTAPALFALGLDLYDTGVPRHGDIVPVLAQDLQAVFSGHYSKAWAVREPSYLKRHGLALRRRKLDGFPFVMPRGTYLAHLKFANLDALEQGNQIREDIAQGAGKGLPGQAWSEARRMARRRFGEIGQLPEQAWAPTEEVAWQALQVPVRDTEALVLRCKSIKGSARTTLPSRLAARWNSSDHPSNR